MNAIEFWTTVGADQTLRVPAKIAEQLQADQEVRVILLLRDDDDERAWRALAAEQFLNGYAESDSIYDDLDVSTR